MTTFYSDLYAHPSAPQVFLGDKRARSGVGRGHAYYIRAAVRPGVGADNSESIRWCTLRSSDRIHSMKLSVTDDGMTGQMGLATALFGHEHDGGNDSDGLTHYIAGFWSHAVDSTVPDELEDRVEVFTELALTDFHRGNRLWVLMGYPSDPMKDFDLVSQFFGCTVFGDGTLNGLLEVFYTAGSS